MRIVILGAGVIGVTSAWYLAQAGHEVVVIDRQRGPALETSFANAGEISPGYASPWAAPGIPRKAIKWLFMEHAPLILRPKVDMAMLRWLIAMLGNCNARDYAVNKGRMVRLAEYSRDQLIELRGATGIAYDERSRGTLQLFREEKQLAGIDKDIAVLKADGVAFEVLDRAGCIAAEPGLSGSNMDIAGGLRLPGDETGDCFKFTNALAGMATDAGVEFRMGETIRRLVRSGDRVTGVETDRGIVTGDALVGERVLVAGLRGGEQREGVEALVADQRLGQLGIALDDVDEVVDDPALGAHDEVEVAQADVEIDDADVLTGLGEGGPQGRGRGGLAHPALAGRHHYDLGHRECSPESSGWGGVPGSGPRAHGIFRVVSPGGPGREAPATACPAAVSSGSVEGGHAEGVPVEPDLDRLLAQLRIGGVGGAEQAVDADQLGLELAAADAGPGIAARTPCRSRRPRSRRSIGSGRTRHRRGASPVGSTVST